MRASQRLANASFGVAALLVAVSNVQSSQAVSLVLCFLAFLLAINWGRAHRRPGIWVTAGIAAAVILLNGYLHLSRLLRS